MIELKLTRKKYTDKQTIGIMEVVKGNVFVCCLATLELNWQENESNESCIPKGDYIVKHYSSDKYPAAFEVKYVKGRSAILIHNGNYNTQTEGCVLVGFSHSDINSDGCLDVIHSKDALNKLNEICSGDEMIVLSII